MTGAQATLLDQIDTLEACDRAIADLLSPEQDLHTVNRDDIAILLAEMNQRRSSLTNELRETL